MCKEDSGHKLDANTARSTLKTLRADCKTVGEITDHGHEFYIDDPVALQDLQKAASAVADVIEKNGPDVFLDESFRNDATLVGHLEMLSRVK